MAEISEYEQIRLRNLADNEKMLKELKKELAAIALPVLTPKSKSRRHKEREHDHEFVRRKNPSRSARYTPLRSPPLTRRRARRASFSSEDSNSNSNDSFQDGAASKGHLLIRFPGLSRFCSQTTDASAKDGDEVNVYDDEDNELVDGLPPQKKRNFSTTRLTRDTNVTEEDIEMVAKTVSDKRYDSVYGTSCHQCRQKTNDQKTICRSSECQGVRGQFCGPCLRNRYGENAQEALRNEEWVCPPCRGICNCSFCRKKKGRSCTGILIHMARENGFADVNSYLQSCR